MKVFIAILLVLALLITGLCFINYFLVNSFNDLILELNDIKACISQSNFEEALNLSNSFDEKFKSKSYWFYMLTDRKPLDEAAVASARLKSFLFVSDEAGAGAAASELQMMLYKIVERSHPSVENIF
ncbi:MAG: DUF4363 family protein [Bacillota bacterium]|nr:DUF4363 family protein [Bacillota bacterium]